MDKMKLAHDWAMSVINGNTRAIDAIDFVERAWTYADAMQAEADKREQQEQNKLKQEQQNHHDELVSIGLEEWQPDWSQAPDDATAWEYLGHNTARWHTTKNGAFRGADLFGYSGVGMLLVERPHGF